MSAKGIQLDDALRNEYEELFESCDIIDSRKEAVKAATHRILKGKPRYERVADQTGVPWFVVGAIHELEGACRFDRHLHNGDPLNACTVHWPKNRPAGEPPFSWEQSAVDALSFTGLSRWNDWSIAGALFKLESYNGLGYRLYHPEVKSPYLWSFTNQYSKGKYAADRQFDPNLVSQQAGVVALLLGLEEVLNEVLLPRAPSEADCSAGALVRERPSLPPPYPGRVIKRGEVDRRLVRSIQETLIKKRCGPISVDGVFGPGTESAVKLFQSRSVDRYGVPLGMDGRIGPLTWEALFGEQSVVHITEHEQNEPLVAAALAVADTQVGVTEEPPYKDSGEKILEYQSSVGNGSGTPWCAAFVYWCFEQAAQELKLANPVVKTGLCLQHWREANERGIPCITAEQAREDPSLLMPGQVFIMDFGEGRGHTGFVMSVEGGLIETIEGNTNSAGSRDGHGVYRKKQRRISDINMGFIDYGALTPAQRPEEDSESVPERPTGPTVAGLVEIAPLIPTMKSGGLLLKAVEMGAFEQPIWHDVPYGDLIVKVGAHALRANVGGRLLRLPVSYCDAIQICKKLGWIVPNAELCDAIWEASTMRIGHVPMGDRSTEAGSAIADKKMVTLEYSLGMNARMDSRIPPNRWGELTDTEGKYWILSKRNLLPSRGGGPHSKGVANYGWHQPPRGEVVQDIGPDSSKPWHDIYHCDYSQTLRPIQRMARRADGTQVDLLEEVEKHGIPAAVLTPFRAGAPS